MKLGYSILLGEFVPANQARHADTAGFQIVCPCCKDPVFKAERLGGNDVLEYFSHYASKDGTQECELRVAGISEGQQQSVNAASKGQTLKVFLSVIRDAMALAWTTDDYHRDRWGKIKDASALSWFVDSLDTHMQAGRWLKESTVEETLDSALSDVDLLALREAGGLDVSFRRRLVKDVIGHLRSPHAAKNRKAMIVHGLRNTIQAFWTAEALGEIDVPMRNMFQALTGTRQDWGAWLKRMNEREGPDLKVFGDLHFMIEMFMMRDLLRLPVLKMLENHRAGRPPLHDILALDYLPAAPTDTADPIGWQA